MKVSLMNLGDAPRVIYDRKKTPIFIEIGHVVPADVGRRVLDGIMQHRDTETLIIAPAGEGTVPEELVEVLSLLQVIQFEEYSNLLVRINKICPPLEATDMRPTRIQMRTKLRMKIEDYIRSEAHAERLLEMSRTFIKEEGDPAQLKQEEQKSESEVVKDTPPATPERTPASRSSRNKDK